jgi:hypothetical protein
MLDFRDILGNYAICGRELGLCGALQQYGGPFWYFSYYGHGSL